MTGRRLPTGCRTTAICSPGSSRTPCRAIARCGATWCIAGSGGTVTGCPLRSKPRRNSASPGHPGDHQVRHRRLQRRLSHQRAALHQRVGALRHPPGPLGRLRERLQDARPVVHGERHVGVPVPLGQGSRLRGLPRPGVLLALRDATVQHRDAHGRRLSRSSGSGADRRLRAGDRRTVAGLDDHPVDVAGQPGPRRRARRRLRRRRAGWHSVRAGRGSSGCLRPRVR